ncbi:hypothetical protein S7711_05137 [Stachybotrys chartarum IBT 7711]|uniref:Peptidase A1 domain-containing protein n=1 Tax=Stachybotrys chartarum (strain CBS 109288 / IBT 7711) TaxID=1280523 RepID=A0A084B4I3_STACB|nr:hypothetical protein S7711_05137 [Stachybotrys chartarum IBT 7711]KFA48314.1 hypothetical protein S40293_04470 [Stachybotrys chartarum IBT 40293]
MKAASVSYVVAHLVALAQAAPTDIPNGLVGEDVNRGPESQAFSVNQIHNEGFRPLDAPAALIRAHFKYSDTLPRQLRNAIEMNPDLRSRFSSLLLAADGQGQNGTVAAYPTPWFDTQYVVPVSIGTPPQITYLNLDTGSADFWTFTTDTYQPQVQGQILYDPEASNTSRPQTGERWSIRYGDGAYAAGIVYHDRVQLGRTFVDQQAVQSAIQVSYAISSDSFSSGIMGMARSDGNTVRPTPQKTYIDNVKDSLEEPVFTANLLKGMPGNYDFGYIDESLYNGNIEYANVTDMPSYWHINVSGFQVGSNGTYQDDTFGAIVDTGTTLLLVPEEVVSGYYSQVPGARYNRNYGMITYPCEARLPDFVFGIGDYRGVVPGYYINYGGAEESRCFGGIQSSEGIPFAVLGDVLLKAQFVVFDAGRNRVGFANKDPVPEN